LTEGSVKAMEGIKTVNFDICKILLEKYCYSANNVLKFVAISFLSYEGEPGLKRKTTITEPNQNFLRIDRRKLRSIIFFM
jgi:hypothetical protein